MIDFGAIVKLLHIEIADYGSLNTQLSDLVHENRIKTKFQKGQIKYYRQTPETRQTPEIMQTENRVKIQRSDIKYEKLFKCKACEKFFITNESLIKHYEKKHGLNLSILNTPKILENKKNKKKITKSNNQKLRFKCTRCSKMFNTKENLVKHLKEKEERDEYEKNRKKDTVQKLIKMRKTQISPNENSGDQTNILSEECKYCGAAVIKKDIIKSISLGRYASKKNQSENQVIYYCKKCGKEWVE